MITKDGIDLEQSTDEKGNHCFIGYSEDIRYVSDLDDLEMFLASWCEEYIDADVYVHTWYETCELSLTVHNVTVEFNDDVDAMAFKLLWF